jgi:hypothetical protein
MLDPMIPMALQDRILRELEPGESVSWSGMPKPVYFNAGTTAAFLFAIPWTAFALFWMAGAARFQIPQFNQGADLFPLFGIPFVLVGFGMLSAPLWHYRSTQHTVYVITDRRAITLDGGWSITIRSYPPEKLNDVFRREHRDGTGDVIISHHAWRDSDGDKQKTELGLMRIADAKDVEHRLKQLAMQADSQSV